MKVRERHLAALLGWCPPLQVLGAAFRELPVGRSAKEGGDEMVLAKLWIQTRETRFFIPAQLSVLAVAGTSSLCILVYSSTHGGCTPFWLQKV